jgi:hypothetical protein
MATAKISYPNVWVYFEGIAIGIVFTLFFYYLHFPVESKNQAIKLKDKYCKCFKTIVRCCYKRCCHCCQRTHQQNVTVR